MNKAFGNDDARLSEYVHRVFAPEDALLEGVRARQAAAGLPDIQVAALDGLHLTVLARAVGAKRAVEVGTLGGYSGVCLLRGMGEGASLHTFELEERHAAVARETFRLAGLEARAHVHVGRALERLREVEPFAPFDLVFIDADKESYPAYAEWAAEHLRVGGVVLGDNAFLFGRIVDETTGDGAERIAAMRRFHGMLAGGGRFAGTLLPTGEGLALGVKVR